METLVRYALIVSLAALSWACQSRPFSPADRVTEKKPQIRHGWSILSGPAPTQLDITDLDSVRRGERLFSMHCAGCHGAQAKGDGDLAKIFNVHARDLTRLAEDTHAFYIFFQVNEGVGDMPRWKDVLSPRDSMDISNYVLSLLKK